MKFRTLVLLALMALPAAWAEGQGVPRPAHRKMFAELMKVYEHPPDESGGPTTRVPPPAHTAPDPSGSASKRDPRMLPWARQRHLGVHGAQQGNPPPHH